MWYSEFCYIITSWDGIDILDLQKEIQRIQTQQKSDGDPRSSEKSSP